jgi:hypothetical protein
MKIVGPVKQLLEDREKRERLIRTHGICHPNDEWPVDDKYLLRKKADS